MKIVVFLYGLFVFWGCGNTSVSEAALPYLNGYWEIASVELPEGSQKQYTANPSVDFIQLEKGKGFRKKLQPQLDGTYRTSNDGAFVTVRSVNNTFVLQYKNDFSTWKETLVQLDSTSFSVRNTEGILYAYRRFRPITIPQ